MLLRGLSRRDALLVIVGASSMHLWSMFLRTTTFGDTSSNSNHHLNLADEVEVQVQLHQTTSTHFTTSTILATSTVVATTTATPNCTPKHRDDWSFNDLDILLTPPNSHPLAKDDVVTSESKPQTAPLSPSELVAHAPGWTLIRNLYMSNGTLQILLPPGVEPTKPSFYTSPPRNHGNRQGGHRVINQAYAGPNGEDLTYAYTSAPGWPELRRMMSSGLEALPGRGNEAEREPTAQHVRFIEWDEGAIRWGAESDPREAHDTRYPLTNERPDTIWTVKGNTLLFNDPSQFLRHYYHFVAELFFGVQAFWTGAFSKPSIDPNDLTSHFSSTPFNTSSIPPIHRAIFMHSNADGWRDNPGFNSYFLRGVFPSLTTEHIEDWQDRIKATSVRAACPPSHPECTPAERVWRFPLVLLVDRSAAHRGKICGSFTQRTAAESWDFMRRTGRLGGIAVGGWWAAIREQMWKFAGIDTQVPLYQAIDGQAIVDGLHEETTKTISTVLDLMKDVQGPAKMLDLEPEIVRERNKVLDPKNAYQDALPMPEEVVITYISRQSARHRKLTQDAHSELLTAMNDLVTRAAATRKSEEDALSRAGSASPPLYPKVRFDFVEAEHLTLPAQIQHAAATTIMLGVHGNGLTHLLWMPPTRLTSVIELFCPGGFSHDYQWTSRALGMRHWGVWNDTLRGGSFGIGFEENPLGEVEGGLGIEGIPMGEYSDAEWRALVRSPEALEEARRGKRWGKPDVGYPECFQRDEIPVWGEGVARLIEFRIEEGVQLEREQRARIGVLAT